MKFKNESAFNKFVLPDAFGPKTPVVRESCLSSESEIKESSVGVLAEVVKSTSVSSRKEQKLEKRSLRIIAVRYLQHIAVPNQLKYGDIAEFSAIFKFSTFRGEQFHEQC